MRVHDPVSQAFWKSESVQASDCRDWIEEVRTISKVPSRGTYHAVWESLTPRGRRPFYSAALLTLAGAIAAIVLYQGAIHLSNPSPIFNSIDAGVSQPGIPMYVGFEQITDTSSANSYANQAVFLEPGRTLVGVLAIGLDVPAGESATWVIAITDVHLASSPPTFNPNATSATFPSYRLKPPPVITQVDVGLSQSTETLRRTDAGYLLSGTVVGPSSGYTYFKKGQAALENEALESASSGVQGDLVLLYGNVSGGVSRSGPDEIVATPPIEDIPSLLSVDSSDPTQYAGYSRPSVFVTEMREQAGMYLLQAGNPSQDIPGSWDWMSNGPLGVQYATGENREIASSESLKSTWAGIGLGIAATSLVAMVVAYRRRPEPTTRERAASTLTVGSLRRYESRVTRSRR